MKSVFRSFVSRNGLPVLLFFSVWLVSACSGSGESMSSNAVSGATTIGTPEFDASEPADDAASSLAGGDQSNTTTNELQNDSTNTNGSAEPTAESTTPDTTHTRVEFRITVPAYQSDALQVQLEWGNETLNGIWSGDESWVVLGDFPVDTQHRLRISFNDLNGEITLGLFEMDYKTEFADSDIVEVSADQFNTAEWDDDHDDVSNLDELKQGGNPQGNDAIEPVQASIELLPIKTFRISWNTTPNAQYYRVLENPDGVSDHTEIRGKLEATTTNFDHYIALYTRFNARYMVQACGADQTCSD